MSAATSNTGIDEVTPPAIAAVLHRLLASAQDSAVGAYMEVAENTVVEQALQHARAADAEKFYFTLLYPLDQAIEGLVAVALPESAEARFLIKHYDFVERQLSSLFSQYEGRACSVDKADFVISCLLRYFGTKQPIVINRTQQYTYHLPEKVLTTAETMLSFFDAVWRLYYGRPRAFLSEMGAIASANPAAGA